jgi:hypothetical protein
VAVLGLLIPAAFWTGMCLMGIFSRPAWWEWPLDILFSLVALLGIPIVLAASLFRDKKTSEHFTTTAAS